MSCFNLGKKLLPARKALKSFTIALHKKLHKLRRPKSISTLRALLHCPRRRHNKRKRSLTKSSKPSSSAHHVRRHRQYRQQHYSPVYVDELFMDTAIKFQVISNNNNKQPVLEARSVEHRMEETTGLKKLEIGSEKKVGDCDLRDGCSTSAAAAPRVALELRGVDERAEEFIAKFREEMRLEREESYGDFQEMLARGL